MKLRTSACNGDLKLAADLDAKIGPRLTCLPSSTPLNGLINGSSKRSPALLAELPVHFDCPSRSENARLSSESNNQVMLVEDRDDNVSERKENGFIVVQKKQRRPKIVAAVSNSLQGTMPLNGCCVSTNGIINAVNCFTVDDILEASCAIIGRNSSEGSSARSLASDIADLSHFHDVASCSHLNVDAPLCCNDDAADDDKEASLSSLCSTMSSAESRQRLDCPSPAQFPLHDARPLDDLLQDRLNVLVVGDQEHDKQHVDLAAEEDLVRHSTLWLPGNSSGTSMQCPNPVVRCVQLCCVMPYMQQRPVIFCDSGMQCIGEEILDVTFSFGCTLSDHLTDGGVCQELSHWDIGADVMCGLNGASRLCSELLDVGDSCCDGVSFMFSDSVLQQSGDKQSGCIERREKSTQPTHKDLCHGPVSVPDQCVFQVRDVQSYMFAMFEDAWMDMRDGLQGVELYSAAT